MKTSNQKASIYTTNKQDFWGSNTFGNMVNGSYAVFSYGRHFTMYIFKSGKWYENSDKYSISTSKQQNQLRPSIIGSFIMKTTDKMIKLLNK